MQFLAHAHARTHTQPHTHSCTSLQCPSPELSPNICGAQHAQQTAKPCNGASLCVYNTMTSQWLAIKENQPIGSFQNC